MSKLTSRPRVEGAREDEILDATLDLLLEVGYDRLTMDAVATSRTRQQGDALPPLGEQAEPGGGRDGAGQAGTHRRGARHRARCAVTWSARSAALTG